MSRNMSPNSSRNPNPRTCTHIKVNGISCGSPSLRGEAFCYFHQRLIRGVQTPAKSRLHPIALIEDETAIQVSLMEIINALIRNTIDYRRAQLILRALHIAVRNSPRAHFSHSRNEMVKDIPDYPAPPAAAPSDPEALAQAGALSRIPRPKPVPTQTVVAKTTAAQTVNPINASAINLQPVPVQAVASARPRKAPTPATPIDPTLRKPPNTCGLPKAERSLAAQKNRTIR